MMQHQSQQQQAAILLASDPTSLERAARYHRIAAREYYFEANLCRLCFTIVFLFKYRQQWEKNIYFRYGEKYWGSD
jgi:hypothetical protein